MARFLIAPDSFKGTLSSFDAGRTIAEALRESVPGARTRCMAVSDGGDGTVAALLSSIGGEEVELEVCGPAGTPVKASYAILSDGTAAIEMSAACGARLAPEGLSPSKATTRGVGELLLDAARRGCTEILLGLGGSATTDAGSGAASACGVKFLDRYVEAFEPTGATLDAVESVDVSGIDPALRGVAIRTLCAVDNPLCGAMGTSAAFSPTKGALPTVVAQLDDNLAHLAAVIERDLGVDVLSMSCGGAGGGMAAGMAAFFGAQPHPGIDVVLDRLGFDERLGQADFVVTGEGCFDAQSLHGKVVAGIARRCKRAGVPLVAVVGTMDDALLEAGLSLGVTTFVVLNPARRPLSLVTKHPRARLARATMALGRILAEGKEPPALVEPPPER